MIKTWLGKSNAHAGFLSLQPLQEIGCLFGVLIAGHENSSSSGNRRNNGYSLVAQSLARSGVTLMFGVIGIPVTELASAVQALIWPSACTYHVSFHTILITC